MLLKMNLTQPPYALKYSREQTAMPYAAVISDLAHPRNKASAICKILSQQAILMNRIRVLYGNANTKVETVRYICGILQIADGLF